MFCKNCGKQLADNAFACPECGTLVNPETQKQSSAQVKKKKCNTAFLISLFSIFAWLGVCDVSFYLMYLIAHIRPSISTVDYYKWRMIFSILSFGCGITAFVFGCIEKENKALKLISVLVLISSLVSCLSCIRTYTMYYSYY